jgi:hypothetical protein
MNSEKTDDSTVISDKSNIRISVGVVSGLILSLAFFAWAKLESDRTEIRADHAADKLAFERQLSELSARIDAKADKSEAEDRWTSKQQDAFQETLTERHRTLDVRIESLRRENQLQHESLKDLVDHIGQDAAECKRKLGINGE